MKIVRDGKEYELTSEELAAANAEFVTNFMKSEMMGRCEISDEELAEELAEQAYDRYCEGNGETEGECIDWAYYSWLESTKASSIAGNSSTSLKCGKRSNIKGK